MHFTFRQMAEADARSILSWRYEPPYDIYNLGCEDVEAVVQFLIAPQNGYYAIADQQNNMVGFCCFGLDARVPGGDYQEEALDIGLGMRPDLTGRGHGHDYVQAVIRFARSEFWPTALRVSIAEFNRRALRVWQRAGFRPARSFAREADGKIFLLLMCEA
jgi:RimJ/RimL family protein N-acetyltransferase